MSLSGRFAESEPHDNQSKRSGSTAESGRHRLCVCTGVICRRRLPYGDERHSQPVQPPDQADQPGLIRDDPAERALLPSACELVGLDVYFAVIR